MLHSVFRVDASQTIGSGHVMRCLTLADEIERNNGKIIFICRELPGHMCDFIESKGYPVYRLPYNDKVTTRNVNPKTLWSGEDALIDRDQTIAVLKRLANMHKFQWLIVDHYGLESKWEQPMRLYVEHIMVIDDLADRKHDCDLLLDQNLYDDMYYRYKGLIPEHCKQLVGPQFVILRPEFYRIQDHVKIRTGTVQNIIIFFGGSDITNETQKALEALKMINRPDIHIDVVVGNINQYKEIIRQQCNEMKNTSFHCQIDYMAELLVKADVAIGAGGATTWERCFLGLPAFIIVLAENQKATTEVVARKGAILNLGWYAEVDIMKIYHNLLDFINNAEKIKNMSRKALEICNNASGISGLELVIRTMRNLKK